MRVRNSRHHPPVARPGPGGPPARSGLAWSLAAATLAGLTLFAYRGVLGHGFVDLDDGTYVTENALVLGRHLGALLRAVVSNNYHPLTMLSLAWNVGDPLTARPFLLTNLLLHTLGTLLVFWLAARLSHGRLAVAAFAAVLFGIHPMHVESVAWISERKDVLHVVFYLTAAIVYSYHLERPGIGRLSLCFVAFLLACLAKGTAVSFPLAMLAMDLWWRRPLRARRVVVEKLPFLAVALLFGLVALDVQAGGDFHGLLRAPAGGATVLRAYLPGSWLEQVALPTYGYLMYAWRLFVPRDLCAFHPYPRPGALGSWPYAIAPLFLLATVALAVWDMRRSRILTFAVGWYLGTVGFVLQWIPVGMAIMADRYAYLPHIGLGFAWGMGMQRAWERRRAGGAVLWGASALFVAVLLFLTPRQVATWRNGETLWTQAIHVYPRCGTLYAWRGNARFLAGRVEEADADLERAYRMGDRSAAVYDGLGSVYGARGRADSAVVMFDRALRVEPGRVATRRNRATALLMLGRAREALAELDRAVALGLASPDVPAMRGVAYFQLDDPGRAAAEFSRAIAAGAGPVEMLMNRGICRVRLGQRDGAAADFREVLRLNPGNPAARDWLVRLGSR
jgi:protein O-mannosyl-transferase